MYEPIIFVDLHELIQAEIEGLMVVQMIRSPVQVGIAQARMLGVQLSKGDVLAFLDSHCKLLISENKTYSRNKRSWPSKASL